MNCPIVGARGTQGSSGSGTCGVMVLGDMMDEQDWEVGYAFSQGSRAGSVLDRAIRRIGAQREMFSFWNVLPTRPPKKAKLTQEAVEWGREYLDEQIQKFKPRCILALGNLALRAVTGLSGDKLGVGRLTGYVVPGLMKEYPPVVPMFHPSYLRQGHMSLLGVLMRTLRLAMLVAREHRQPILPPVDAPPEGYQLYPTEAQAEEFAREVEQLDPERGYLAYDIETNYSNEEDSAEERAGAIKSIQFSFAQGTGIFFPWRESFIPISSRLLSTRTRKISWNGWKFDDPRLREAGCRIEGQNIDLMWAWHHLQPDLPRNLQFAAAMQGPNIYSPTHSWPWPYKHLDKVSPQFYGIVDVDVLMWMVTY